MNSQFGHSIRKDFLALLIVGLVGFSLSFFVSYLLFEKEMENIVNQKQAELESDIHQFLDEIRFWSYTLVEVEAFYNASTFVDEDEFLEFTSTISHSRSEDTVYGWIAEDNISGQLLPTYLYPREEMKVSHYIDEDIWNQIVALKEHDYTQKGDLKIISNIRTMQDVPFLILFKGVERKNPSEKGVLGALFVLVSLENIEAYDDLRDNVSQLKISDYYTTRDKIRTLYDVNNKTSKGGRTIAHTEEIGLDGHFFEIVAQRTVGAGHFKQYTTSIFVFLAGIILTLFCLVFMVIMADRYAVHEVLSQSRDKNNLEDEQGEFHKKAENLWKRSLVCFVLIGIFVSSVYTISEIASQKTEDGAVAINISGRQRMLSQRIALFANEYVYQIERDEASDDAKEFLKAARDLFEKSHKALVFGDAILGLTGRAGEVAKDIYYEEPHSLDQQVSEYIALADLILKDGSVQEKQTALLRVNEMSADKLLFSLNAVVKALEVYETDNVKDLLLIERVSFAITVFLLLVSIIFVM